MEKMSLYCIPYAAGSALNFYRWSRYLPANIELHPLEPAGRGQKSERGFYRDMDEAIGDLFKDFCKEYHGEKYLIFGHSFGCWLAYELYYRIKEEKMALPRALFFSGRRPPYVPNEQEEIDNLSDEAMMRVLNQFENMNQTILCDDALRRQYLHVLRADYLVMSQCCHKKKDVGILSDVLVMSGTQDATIKSSDLLAWKDVCDAGFQICKIPGGHFFPFTNIAATVDTISKRSSEYADES